MYKEVLKGVSYGSKTLETTEMVARGLDRQMETLEYYTAGVNKLWVFFFFFTNKVMLEHSHAHQVRYSL